jgi:hypothetical protein
LENIQNPHILSLTNIRIPRTRILRKFFELRKIFRESLILQHPLNIYRKYHTHNIYLYDLNQRKENETVRKNGGLTAPQCPHPRVL